MLSKLPGVHLISYSFRAQGTEGNIEENPGRVKGPVHKDLDIFESATFSFRIRLPSTRIRWIRHTNPQRFESALNSQSGIMWTPNADIFHYPVRNKSKPSSLPWILYSRWHALLSIFPEESWVLAVNPDTCEIRVESGYVWAWKLFKPQRKICGF